MSFGTIPDLSQNPGSTCDLEWVTSLIIDSGSSKLNEDDAQIKQGIFHWIYDTVDFKAYFWNIKI